jgi:hypothetical protein
MAALVLFASLFAAPGVLGRGQRVVVPDPRGDGGGFAPHKRPGVCDIVEATSELAKKGHLRHTVTTRGRMNLTLNAPPVVITKRRVHGRIGLASYILTPGDPQVWSHLRNHRRTIVYFVKRRVIREAVGRTDKYFWVADQCPIHDDRAPNRSSAVQRLRNRHHHR